MHKLPDLETLNNVFTYKDGILFWKNHNQGQARTGKIAGSTNRSNYKFVCVNRVSYAQHRIIYAMNICDPGDKFIDHINGNPSDNRIENLRLCDQKLNTQNKRVASKNNRAKLLGVGFIEKTGMYRARIRVNKKLIHIGHFKTKEEAHNAYIKEKRKHHEFCTI